MEKYRRRYNLDGAVSGIMPTADHKDVSAQRKGALQNRIPVDIAANRIRIEWEFGWLKHNGWQTRRCVSQQQELNFLNNYQSL